MHFNKFTKSMAFVLAFLLLVVPSGISVSASSSKSGAGFTTQSLAELLNTSNYSEYYSRYEAIPRGTQTYVIKGDDVIAYDPSLTGLAATSYDTDEEYQAALAEFNASLVKTEITDRNGITDSGLYLPSDGTVGWKTPEMEEGRYAISFRYTSDTSEKAKTTPIERTLYLNQQAPFQEARFLEFSKVWTDKATTFQTDVDGNVVYKYMNDEGKIVYSFVNEKLEVLEPSTDNERKELRFVTTGKTLGESDVKDLTKYPVYANDIGGNETKTAKEQVNEWSVYTATDSTGYYSTPFEFYFKKGVNTIQLQAQREGMILSEIVIFPYSELMSYDEYIKDCESKGAADAKSGFYKLQAEYPTATSENTIYANSDRTSWITEPQLSKSQLLNSIGGDGGSKWSSMGQWVRYEVDVEESGFYSIVLRYRQSQLEGTFSSRILRVATASMLANGEQAKVPFAQAYNCQFNYNSDWQVTKLSDGDTEFKIYLEKGKNVIELEASLGNMASILKEVQSSINTVNGIYIKLLMLTGATPNKDQDYGFYRIMPDDIDELLVQANKLYEISENFTKMVKTTGSHAKTLDKVAQLLERMGSDEEKIAANMGNLKDNLGTLGTWLNTSLSSPLELDYIIVQPVDAKLPKAKDNFWQTLWFEIQMFFNSFVIDYNTLGTTLEINDDECIEVWTTLGRDQAIIIRGLINSDFYKQYPDVVIKLKLVAGGSLLPSVLAGVGPDVSLQHGSTDIINWSIRGAIQPLNGFDDASKGYIPFSEAIGTFNEETETYQGGWFTEAAITNLTLYAEYEDGTKTHDVYAIPETQNFYMMFYRADILSQLGIKVPETWDDVISMISVLQENNMQIALPTKQAGTDILLYQMGGDLYAENGKRINYDSDVALSAFKMLTKFFTDYSQPKDYSFVNRFRTGEIPVGIVNYTEYTQLSVYATEIRGMWEFVQLPGYIMSYNEDGTRTVNHTSTASVTGNIMVKDDKRTAEKNEDCWRFLAWFSGAETQTNYANELTALLGTESKHNTANVKALESLPWTTQEYKNLTSQFNDKNLSAVREYPGGYIISRYVGFAFLAVYNDGAEPVDAMLGYVTNINAEITRKRQEFGLACAKASSSSSFSDYVEEAK